MDETAELVLLLSLVAVTRHVELLESRSYTVGAARQISPCAHVTHASRTATLPVSNASVPTRLAYIDYARHTCGCVTSTLTGTPGGAADEAMDTTTVVGSGSHPSSDGTVKQCLAAPCNW